MLSCLFFVTIWLLNTEIYKADSCGRPITHKSRIVGGYDIGYYKYPWFAALLIDDVLNCGGTLISHRHVLTAAHCFSDFIVSASFGQIRLEDVYTVKLGVYNICKSEITQKSFKVSQVFIHELYVKNRQYFDIALLTLDSDAKGFEPCCLPIKVYGNTRPPDGLIQGLGSQEYGSMIITCTIREAKVLIYGDQVCRDMLTSMNSNGSDLTGAFCAGYLKGGIDSCQGDSGGPLSIIDPKGHHTVLGITSFGYRCADKNSLGVYTDVSNYLEWIEEKMHNHTLPSPKIDSVQKPIPVVEETEDTTQRPITTKSNFSEDRRFKSFTDSTSIYVLQPHAKRHTRENGKSIRSKNHKGYK